MILLRSLQSFFPGCKILIDACHPQVCHTLSDWLLMTGADPPLRDLLWSRRVRWLTPSLLPLDPFRVKLEEGVARPRRCPLPPASRISGRDLSILFRSILLPDDCFVVGNHRIHGLFATDFRLDYSWQQQYPNFILYYQLESIWNILLIDCSLCIKNVSTE